jgi:hypothetical protein
LTKLLIILSLFCTPFSNAQPGSSDSNTVYNISVITYPSGAKIYLDSLLIGQSPIDNFELKKKEFLLEIINPVSLSRWRDQNFRQEIELQGDTSITIKFDYFYYFNSNPFNAQVIYRDSLIGLTPLRYFNKEKLIGDITIRKDNYIERVFNLKNYNFKTGYRIKLIPVEKHSFNIVFKNRDTEFKTKRNFLLISSFGAAALLSTYTTINFKNVANQSYDRYLLNYNSDDLDDANRYDIYAAISLVVMQIALAGVIYFLFIE